MGRRDVGFIRAPLVAGRLVVVPDLAGEVSSRLLHQHPGPSETLQFGTAQSNQDKNPKRANIHMETKRGEALAAAASFGESTENQTSHLGTPHSTEESREVSPFCLPALTLLSLLLFPSFRG